MQVTFPYLFENNRPAGSVEDAAHVRQMLELLLFTMPGERVNRPDYGCGIQRMVFAPQNTEVVATLRTLIEAEIQRWLGDVLSLRNLQVTGEDATLQVVLTYQLASDGSVRQERFKRSV